MNDGTDVTPLALPSVAKEKDLTKPQTEPIESSSLPAKCTVDIIVAPQCVSASTQTEFEDIVPRVTWNDGEEDEQEEEEERSTSSEEDPKAPTLPPRPLEKCLAIFKSDVSWNDNFLPTEITV